MSVKGAPQATLNDIDARGLRVAIIAGTSHPEIADGLRAGARRALETMGATIVEVEAPGSFELPLLSKAALDGGADAAVALGVIIRGGTPHFDFVADAATSGLTQVALLTGKPVGFGVLTLDDEQQGLDRAGLPGSKEDKGAEAAEAAVRAALTVRQIRLAFQDPDQAG
jgi:6,7-dimethyl-8-ribityllumazine synthase